MPSNDGGLGSALVGEKIVINQRQVAVTKLLGEGGFSYVYLVKEIADATAGGSLNTTGHNDTRSGGGDASTKASGGRSNSKSGGGASNGSKRSGSLGKAQAELQSAEKVHMVLKVTSILSRQQRDIAEKEAKLLSRLSHPSIIKMYDTCYRTVSSSSGGGGFRKSSANDDSSKAKDRPQHLILMEFCEGGHALDVCNNLASKGEHFDLSTLIIAFGQICNAVSYLHAQRPPIVHRDLKPANFLVKNGAYKLCDFGSAVFGHVDLKTSEARNEAEEVIQKTTTQMFRAPEMVDLYMAKKLTQATDVWALGACLYSLAFLQNCFEEGSNLAILSRKYKIPDDNPYGDGLVELLDRMLTVDSKARADMTEVILCLSAVYSGRPLPPRKERSSKSKDKEKEDATAAGADGAAGGAATGTADAAGGSNSKRGERSKHKKSKNAGGERVGTFRTDGQGIYQENLAIDPSELKKSAVPAKKLDPNSAAARRRMAAAGAAAPASGDSTAEEFASFHDRFDETAQTQGAVNEDLAFSTQAVDAFGDLNISKGSSDGQGGGGGQDLFASFDDDCADGGAPVGDDAFGSQAWGQSNDFTSFDAATNADKAEATAESAAAPSPSAAATAAASGESGDEDDKDKETAQRRRRASSKGRTRRREGHERKKKDDDDEHGVGQDEGVEETLENMEEVMAANSEDNDGGGGGEDGAKDRASHSTARRGSRSTGRTSRKSATGTTSTAASGADTPPVRQKSISRRSSRRAEDGGKSRSHEEGES